MRIGFIGTGAMAQAIARGAVASGVDPATLVFSNRTATKACDLADELGATAASSNVSLARQVDVVILAVKPKDQRAVIKEIAPVVVGRTDVCIVSLAAGRTLDQITQDFGSGIPLIRVMPNVAATVALGGVGMDDTRVQLMVDPATKRNTHTLHVEGLFGEFHLELSGLPLASNPKTSTLAALSAVRACRELALS